MSSSIEELTAEAARQNERFKPWFDLGKNVIFATVLCVTNVYYIKYVYNSADKFIPLASVQYLCVTIFSFFTILTVIMTMVSVHAVAMNAYNTIVLKKIESIEGVKQRKMRFFPLFLLSYIAFILLDSAVILMIFGLITAVILK